MKFSYSVIGDNIDAHIDWLIKLGGQSNGGCDYDEDKYVISYNRGDSLIYTTSYNDGNLDDLIKGGLFDNNPLIDCRGNSPLFKAVSAMRGDSDYGQWFMCQTSRFTQAWYLCEEDNYIQWAKKQKPFLNSLVLAHKATLTELQERFKL